MKNLLLGILFVGLSGCATRPANVPDTTILSEIQETLDALDNLVKAGKVKYIGISNESAWGSSQYLKLAEQKKNARIVSIQNAYNFLNRGFEVDLSEIAIRE